MVPWLLSSAQILYQGRKKQQPLAQFFLFTMCRSQKKTRKEMKRNTHRSFLVFESIFVLWCVQTTKANKTFWFTIGHPQPAWLSVKFHKCTINDLQPIRRQLPQDKKFWSLSSSHLSHFYKQSLTEKNEYRCQQHTLDGLFLFFPLPIWENLLNRKTSPLFNYNTFGLTLVHVGSIGIRFYSSHANKSLLSKKKNTNHSPLLWMYLTNINLPGSI